MGWSAIRKPFKSSFAVLALSMSFLASQASASEYVYLAATLPGPGTVDEDGVAIPDSFTAEGSLTAGELCYTLRVAGNPDFAAAAIEHTSSDGTVTEIAQIVPASLEEEATCVTLEPQLMQDLAANQASYRIRIDSGAEVIVSERIEFEG